MSLEVITLGCRLNAAESAAIAASLDEDADLVVVNSCAVTNEAVRQARQAIRRARRAKPGARIVVTGCAAQVEPETFAAMPEVSAVVGNREKLETSSFAPGPLVSSAVETSIRPEPRKGSLGFPRHGPSMSFGANGFGAGVVTPVRVSDIMSVRANAPHLAASYCEKSRAFVEVQNGCDHRCTFCIIPYGRGNSRSVPGGAVVDRIKALVDEGCREVVLTGVDVTSYGPDLPGTPALGQLVERILRHVPTLPRLRLSSIDSVEIDPRLEEIIAHEPRFMPHLHMSFQAGDDLILKRMKRRHSRAGAVETVARLKAKRPGLAIGADLIAGFPTETREMHERSLALIDDCDIVMGHIFPYSPKRGTPAALMPQVPREVVRERARRLREASAKRKAVWLQSMVGTRQKVLVERGGTGHAENFAPILFRHPRESGGPASSSKLEEQERDSRLRGNDGKIVEVLISGIDGAMLVGEPA